MIAVAPALLLLISDTPAAAQALSSAPPANAQSVDANQKIRCRTFTVTGYLAQTRRVCKTLAEWRRSSDAASDEARRMLDQGLQQPKAGN